MGSWSLKRSSPNERIGRELREPEQHISNARQDLDRDRHITNTSKVRSGIPHLTRVLDMK